MYKNLFQIYSYPFITDSMLHMHFFILHFFINLYCDFFLKTNHEGYLVFFTEFDDKNELIRVFCI